MAIARRDAPRKGPKVFSAKSLVPMNPLVHPPLATQTLERAASVLKGGAVTWLPEIVTLMRSLAGNSADVSVGELVEIIEKDATILSKVIAAANTIAFNPSAVAVTCVNQAVHVIGYDRIRTLAMSLALAESRVRQQSPDQQREAVAHALTAGCLAQSLATNRVAFDPGQAFVCASLRNFGRIVMTACMPREYELARSRATMHDEDAVFREAFGLTPLELGRQLLKSADLPPEISNCLRELPPEAFAVLEAKPDDQLLALADFSGRLARLALETADSPQTFLRNSSALAATYGRILPGLGDEVPRVMAEAEAKLTDLVRNLRLSGISLRCLNRLRSYRVALENPDGLMVADGRPASAATPGQLAGTPGASPASEEELAAAEFKFDWREQERAFVRCFETEDLTRAQLLEFLAERLCAGFATRECLIFTGNAGPGPRQLALGRGALYAALTNAPRVKPDDRNVFGLCLTRCENVLIRDTNDAKIRPHLPAWLTPKQLGSFLLLPLADAPRAPGVILIGWEKANQAQLDTQQAQHLRDLLTRATQVYEKVF